MNFGVTATAPLLDLLTRGDKTIYPTLAWALSQIAQVDPSVLPAVIEAMDDENWKVRRGAAEILCYATPVAAIAPLIRSLKEEDTHRRMHIIRALEQVGAAAIPALIESLRSPDWTMRVGSAEALGIIGKFQKFAPIAKHTPTWA